MEKFSGISRRALLRGSVAAAVAANGLALSRPLLAQTGFALPKLSGIDASKNARDEHYWNQIANLFKLSPDFINLENGFYGVLSKPVLADYQQHIARLNETSSYFLRQQYAQEAAKIRAQIAEVAGVDVSEIALTRNATEALQNLIVNYNKLKPGDTVLYADLDYDSAQDNIEYLRTTRGINTVKITIPEPATYESIIETYERAFAEHPRIKLVLLTHIGHRTGLAIPVTDIAELARQKDIDVLVDAAHSWGHLDFKVPELKADFGAFNLHKWIGAPLGVGFIYIRKEKLAAINPHLISSEKAAVDISSRVHTGTTATANVLAVPAALDFHRQLGAANKEARLRYLRDYWVTRVRKEIPNIQILTPDDPRLCGAITSLRIKGKTGKADNQLLAQQLREQHNIFTVARGGAASGDSVRITPAIFTRTSDLDKLVAALKTVARS